MAPKGRTKNIGLRREDAARDRMKDYGFDNHIINKSLKQVLEVYGGEDKWFLIEDGNYEALLAICLEKKKEQEEQEEKKANEAVMDSSSSQAAFQHGQASVDYAEHSVGGATSSHNGWLSSEESEEEDTHPNEDSDSDGDDEDEDEMVELTPEPLCEELEELLREVYGQKKMKRCN